MAAGKQRAARSYRQTFSAALNQLHTVNKFALSCFEPFFCEASDANLKMYINVSDIHMFEVIGTC